MIQMRLYSVPRSYCKLLELLVLISREYAMLLTIAQLAIDRCWVQLNSKRRPALIYSCTLMMDMRSVWNRLICYLLQ